MITCKNLIMSLMNQAHYLGHFLIIVILTKLLVYLLIW